MNISSTLKGIIRWLAGQSAFVRRLVRLPVPEFFNADRNRRIVAQVRRQVFGDVGPPSSSSSASSADLLRRAYAQYLCQVEVAGDPLVRRVHNLLAALILVPVALLWLLRFLGFRLLGKPGARAETIVFQYQPHTRALVESLRPASSLLFLRERKAELSPSDVLFLIRLCREYPHCWLHPYFLLKVLFGVAYYSRAIRRYRPSEIFDFEEHFCAAAVQTAYCRQHRVRHINVMHGDRACVAEYAFTCFDEFYVWGEYYLRLFTDLEIPADQFRVTGNPLHQLLVRELRGRRFSGTPRVVIFFEAGMAPPGPYADLLARLVGEIAGHCHLRLRCCALRAHQASTGEELLPLLNAAIANGAPPIAVESERDRPVNASIADCDIAVGIFTTALFDAWVTGCKVISLHSEQDPCSTPRLPYAASQNVFVYDGSVSPLDFLTQPPAAGPQEDRLLQFVSWQEDLTGRGAGASAASGQSPIVQPSWSTHSAHYD